MAAARKQQQITATMDIQRQGNCTNRNLGRRFQRGVDRRNIMKVATDPIRSRALQVGLRPLKGAGLRANRRDASAVRAANRISASAQKEEIQLNQVCSTSASSVKRKFWAGRRPLESAWPILTQRCS